MNKQTTKNEFGKLVRKLRMERGWSQVELADRLNALSVKSAASGTIPRLFRNINVSSWENQGVLPRRSVMLMLAELFDVKPEDLIPATAAVYNYKNVRPCEQITEKEVIYAFGREHLYLVPEQGLPKTVLVDDIHQVLVTPTQEVIPIEGLDLTKNQLFTDRIYDFDNYLTRDEAKAAQEVFLMPLQQVKELMGWYRFDEKKDAFCRESTGEKVQFASKDYGVTYLAYADVPGVTL